MAMSRSARKTLIVSGVLAGVLILALVAVGGAVWALRIGGGPAVQTGGIYSVVVGDGQYGVVKVLKVDAREARLSVLHVRLYKGRWPERPTQIDPATLTVGSIADADAGLGHLPLSLRVFATWRPRLIMVVDVRPEELDGYEEWRKANGGVWDE
jgi:hypothetical protein